MWPAEAWLFIPLVLILLLLGDKGGDILFVDKRIPNFPLKVLHRFEQTLSSRFVLFAVCQISPLVRIFLKIEREAFYAMFGDFQTGLSVTELSRYDRSLNGLKTEFRGKQFSFNAFASDTDKAFVRDEINGDGTSGPYRLSSSPIVINSDQIEIQVRDRFRSEMQQDRYGVLEQKQLFTYPLEVGSRSPSRKGSRAPSPAVSYLLS